MLENFPSVVLIHNVQSENEIKEQKEEKNMFIITTSLKLVK
jgi:hypothetical protein